MSSADGYDPYTAPVTTQHFATALLGPFFAGWVSHFILGGVVFTQLAAYLETSLYRTDPIETRVLLWTIFVLDLGSLAFHGEQIFHYGTTQDRSFNSVFVSRQIDMIPFLFVGIGQALMSSFLCRRAAGLFNSNMNYQAIFLWGFHSVIGISFVIQCYAVVLLIRGDFYATPSPNTLTGIFLWLSTFVDWSMTVALFLFLRKRFDGNLTSVRHVLSISIQTASYTSILTLLGAITAVAWPTSNTTTANVTVAFQGPLTSLYALSLVVTLASRKERTAIVVGSTHVGLATGDFSNKVNQRVVRKQLGDSDDDEEEEADDEDENEAALAHPHRYEAAQLVSVAHLEKGLGPASALEDEDEKAGEIGLGDESTEDERALASAVAGQGRRVSKVSFASEAV